MKIGVVGCSHGELDKIYETISSVQNQEHIKLDLLIICGDFQAVRNMSDLDAMAVPKKYQAMNTFWKYYKGVAEAPVLTIFIGGNHEASNFLQELPYGGWVAKNIYYMGYASVVQFGGLRIAGLSGIYKSQDFRKGHFERPPYSEGTKRSAYHIRNIEVFRLSQLKRPLDIFISHDWPRGIYQFGPVEKLLSQKKFFRSEIENGSLGNPATEGLLHTIKPKHWFAAHLHCKFAATVQHELANGEKSITKFLALDKCLPHRHFLQFLDLDHDTSKPLELQVDLEWLVILRSTNHLLNLTPTSCILPGFGSGERFDFSCTLQEMDEMREYLGNQLKIPLAFEITAEVHDETKKTKPKPPQMHINNQTKIWCEVFDLTNPYAVFLGQQKHSESANMNLSSASPSHVSGGDSDDVSSDEGDDTFPSFINTTAEMSCSSSGYGDSMFVNVTRNPEEIPVSDDECQDEVSASSSVLNKSLDTSSSVCESPHSRSVGRGIEALHFSSSKMEDAKMHQFARTSTPIGYATHRTPLPRLPPPRMVGLDEPNTVLSDPLVPVSKTDTQSPSGESGDAPSNEQTALSAPDPETPLLREGTAAEATPGVGLKRSPNGPLSTQSEPISNCSSSSPKKMKRRNAAIYMSPEEYSSLQ